jgi:hypothetical protein
MRSGWGGTARAMLKEKFGEGFEEELPIVRRHICWDFESVLKSFWRALIELAVGRFVSVRLVHLLGALETYVRLTNQVHYLGYHALIDVGNDLEMVT